MTRNVDKKYPFVSIIIPTLNNDKDLIGCLNSIKTLDYPTQNTELIIWDNDSQKESKKKVKDFLESLEKETKIKIKFVESPMNLGVYTSRDELLKLVHYDSQFILSIDDDVILPPNIFKGLLAVFNSDNKVGIVGPRTVYDDFPNETAHGAGFVNWWIGRYKDIDSGELEECDYVIGCCFLVKRDVINKLGGFDRDYYTSHGEIDFCTKAKKERYKVMYNPKVVVKHKVVKGGRRTKERLYYLYRNKLLIIKKNASFLQKITSFSLYSIFWLPKIFFDSIIANRSINIEEIKIILKAVFDGIAGRFGKQEEVVNEKTFE